MNRLLIIILSLLLASPLAQAVPARPTPFRHTQPDGSTIILQIHGDEHFHWTTDELGHIVEKDADGFFRPSGKTFQELAEQAKQKQQAQGGAISMDAWSSFDNPPVTNFGDRKVLCIIANFSDKSFIVENPNQHFTDMLNQEGYSFNGSIGSVRDYYIDNSRNQYRPQFDVYGPVTLSQPSSYYAANDDAKTPNAILEAYELLKDQIDINDYDTDGNGSVDMVVFYFPGYNEAEGGGANTIWPHQATGYFGTMGGKTFNRYFCTSELSGSYGQTPASIGTTCHEFAHSLGLPDFYDTDYSSNGYNTFTTGPYDVMAEGSYNDNGRRPPYLNAVERNMLGWMSYPETFENPGDYALPAVQENKAFQFATQTDGEYFVMEARNGKKWDASLQKGLLIYHIDKSSRRITGYLTAGYLWKNSNQINAYGGHPCFYLVPRSANSANRRIFPGAGNVTSYTLTDWNGDDAGLSLSHIAATSTGCSFTVRFTNLRTVTGHVTDSDGRPLKDVQMSLTPSVAPFNAAPSLLSTSLSCTTDENGAYSFSLQNSASDNQILSAQMDGYVPVCVNLTLSSKDTEYNLVLHRQGEGPSAQLAKYDSSLTLFKLSLSYSSAVGVRYSAKELADMGAVGMTMKTLSFLAAAENGESLYVFVEAGGQTVLKKNVTAQYRADQWITVDISADNITIPAGKDIIFGYALTDITTASPFYAYYDYNDSSPDAGYVNWDYPGSSKWERFAYYQVTVSATLESKADIDFSTLGVSFIRMDSGRPTAVVAAGKSLRSTAWYLDGAPVETPPAVGSLAPGAHTYMVRLSYYDGTSERIYYDIDVK